MRPMFHFTERRIEAHICICFIAYKESNSSLPYPDYGNNFIDKKILNSFLELYPQTMKSDKKSYTCKKISFLDTRYKITAFLNGQAYCK